jgi:hypothetical protein
MTKDLHEMESNQIINSLDDLLAQGHTINEVVSVLDDVFIIANYDLLTEKGATNIDLAAVRDRVEPVVVMNNLAVFQNANVPVDKDRIIGLINAFSETDMLYRVLPREIKAWSTLGADTQVISDRYIGIGGVKPSVLEAFMDVGVKLNTDELIESLLDWAKETKEDVELESNVPVLKRAGLNEDSIDEVRKRASELINKH